MNFQSTLTISVCNLSKSGTQYFQPTWTNEGRWYQIQRPKAIWTHAHALWRPRAMDEGGPSIPNWTVQFESYENGGSGCWPFITRWTAPGEPRRTRAGASDKSTEAVSGETPATQAAAARVGASYGCAIALRTFQYHPHPRGWTRTAASRREAAR